MKRKCYGFNVFVNPNDKYVSYRIDTIRSHNFDGKNIVSTYRNITRSTRKRIERLSAHYETRVYLSGTDVTICIFNS